MRDAKGGGSAFDAQVQTGPGRTAEEQAAHELVMKVEYEKSLRLPKSPPKRR